MNMCFEYIIRCLNSDFNEIHLEVWDGREIIVSSLQISLISRWPDGGQSIIRLVNPLMRRNISNTLILVSKFRYQYDPITIMSFPIFQHKHTKKHVLINK